ncbi:MAG: MBL fold metallo-hydrolase [Clostridia bacterium]|nr:MBL fold metallo-hydrolase [Clostridia bacterium]
MKVERVKYGDMDNNAYLITDEASGESALVDPGFFDENIERVVNEVGDKLKYILLTHRHFDHILGAKSVKERTGAKICIHPKDACGLSHAGFSLAQSIGVSQSALTPDYTFNETSKVRLGESTLFVIETPGHTVGSVCFLCNDCLLTGDTLFRLGVGRTDLPTGNYSQLKQSLNRLYEMPGDYKVYPGHGNTSTLDVERTMNPFMIEARNK